MSPTVALIWARATRTPGGYGRLCARGVPRAHAGAGAPSSRRRPGRRGRALEVVDREGELVAQRVELRHRVEVAQEAEGEVAVVAHDRDAQGRVARQRHDRV